MKTQTGTLYGIGVGPGDPELIPMKSVRILGRVNTIFAAASTKNEHSLAVNIARPYIPEQTPVRMLSFPMTRDRAETRKAWREHAETIVSEIERNRDVAFLTLGDSLTYSTYGYILKNVRQIAPHIPVVTVPGITSYQAAAACLNTPLVEGEEALLILSGVQGGDRLRQMTGKPENVVFLKAYRNVGDITAALREREMLEGSVSVSKCGLPEEEVVWDIRELAARQPDYWTLILAKQHRENGRPKK